LYWTFQLTPPPKMVVPIVRIPPSKTRFYPPKLTNLARKPQLSQTLWAKPLISSIVARFLWESGENAKFTPYFWSNPLISSLVAWFLWESGENAKFTPTFWSNPGFFPRDLWKVGKTQNLPPFSVQAPDFSGKWENQENGKIWTNSWRNLIPRGPDGRHFLTPLYWENTGTFRFYRVGLHLRNLPFPSRSHFRPGPRSGHSTKETQIPSLSSLSWRECHFFHPSPQISQSDRNLGPNFQECHFFSVWVKILTKFPGMSLFLTFWRPRKDYFCEKMDNFLPDPDSQGSRWTSFPDPAVLGKHGDFQIL